MWSLITLPFRLAWTALTFVWDIFWGAASLVFGVVGSIVSLLFGTALLGGLIALVARAFGHKDSSSHIVQNDANSVR